MTSLAKIKIRAAKLYKECDGEDHIQRREHHLLHHSLDLFGCLRPRLFHSACHIAARGEGNFVVFNGPDEQFVSGRVIGADGGIGGTYAVMPELYLAMNAHLEKGEIAKARAIQYEANRIIYKMCSAHGNLYAVQKEILRRMYGLELGSVRAPMPGLIPEDEAVVAEAQAMIEAAIAKL